MEGQNPRRVLIVDEDVVEAGLLAFQLRQAGMTALVVGSAQEAFDAMSWAPPDVYLLQFGGTAFDGLEVASALSGRETAVFFSAERAPTPEEELEALDMGIREFFVKPLDHRVVSGQVARAALREIEPGSDEADAPIKGFLADHPLPALLGLCRRMRLHARLEVQTPGGQLAQLVIREGSVIDGIRGERSGSDAVLSVIATAEGTFQLTPVPEDDPLLDGDDQIGMDLATLLETAVKPRSRGFRSRPTTTRRPRSKTGLHTLDELPTTAADNPKTVQDEQPVWLDAVHDDPRTVVDMAPNVHVAMGGPDVPESELGTAPTQALDPKTVPQIHPRSDMVATVDDADVGLVVFPGDVEGGADTVDEMGENLPPTVDEFGETDMMEALLPVSRPRSRPRSRRVAPDTMADQTDAATSPTQAAPMPDSQGGLEPEPPGDGPDTLAEPSDSLDLDPDDLSDLGVDDPLASGLGGGQAGWNTEDADRAEDGPDVPTDEPEPSGQAEEPAPEDKPQTRPRSGGRSGSNTAHILAAAGLKAPGKRGWFGRALLIGLAIAFVGLGSLLAWKLTQRQAATSPSAGLVTGGNAQSEPASTEPASPGPAAVPMEQQIAQHYAEGVLALEQADFERAELAYQEVLAKDPEHAGARAGLANVLIHAGRHEDARAMLVELARLAPDDPMVHLGLGVLGHKTGDLEAAQEALSRFVEIAPKHPLAADAWRLLLATKMAAGEDQPAKADQPAQGVQ